MPKRLLSLRPLHTFASLLPNRCLLCAAAISPDLRLCQPCQGDLPRIHAPCFCCGLPLESDTGTCGQCLLTPPSYSRTVAPLAWASPVNRLVSRYKYRADVLAGQVLADVLAQTLPTAYADDTQPTLLVPVPMHWRRVVWRGFDHAAVLGHQLERALNIPLDTRLLRRTRHAKPQRGQTRTQRQHNLRGAFTATRPLHGECIALIDDVMTTGSTAHELATVLRASGAGEVHVWALARTPER